MNERSIDYKYALDLTKRFNRFVETEPYLSELFVYKGWNFLQIYQAPLFQDMKVWTREQRVEGVRPRTGWLLLLKAFLTGCFQIIVSFVSSAYFIIAMEPLLIFSGDKINGSYKNDFRLEAIYKALNLCHASYGEVLHTLGGREMLERFIKRRRPVIYIEAIDALVSPFVWLRRKEARKLISKLDLSMFEPEERKIVRFELDKYVSAIFITRARLAALRIFFKLSSIRAAFSIDDTRHYNELMGAASDSGIDTYALQHGHFTKYHTGWLKGTQLPGRVMKPNKLIVWSEYWKQELMRLGSIFQESEIIVGGERGIVEMAPQTQAEGMSVLIPYEKDAPKLEVHEYIQKLVKIPSVEVFFKIRSDEDKQKQLEEYGVNNLNHKIRAVTSLEGVIGEVDIVAGTYSTFLYDMVAAGKPVAILETSIDYGEGMIANSLAVLLRKGDNFERALKGLSDTPREEIMRRRNKLIGTEVKELGDTLQDIIRKYV